MAQNYKFFFDKSGTPCARGPAAEKTLMMFLEQDVQGSDYICRDLMNDLTAIEDGAEDLREFIGNAHSINITATGVTIESNMPTADEEPLDSFTGDSATPPSGEPSLGGQTAQDNLAFEVGLKRFREVLEDWEAFILDDQIDDALSEDDYT